MCVQLTVCRKAVCVKNDGIYRCVLFCADEVILANTICYVCRCIRVVFQSSVCALTYIANAC